MNYFLKFILLFFVILRAQAIDYAYVCLYAEDDTGSHVLLATKNDKGYWFDEPYMNVKNGARYIDDPKKKRSTVFYQKGTDIVNYPKKFVLPGGKMKNGEDVQVGSLREFYEETGIPLDDLINNPHVQTSSHVFKATESRKTQHQEYGVLYIKLPTLERLKTMESDINTILLKKCGQYKGKLKKLDDDFFNKKTTSDGMFLKNLDGEFPPTHSNELNRVGVYEVGTAIGTIINQGDTYWFQHILENLDGLEESDD